MTRFLCAADIHIGRVASRTPGSGYRAAAAWLDLVNHAVTVRVDAVLLAGDIIDQESGYFEAAGALDAGLRRLKAEGIPVVAVSGNHDHAVLHKLAPEVGAGHLTMLGQGGDWERHTLRRSDGSTIAHIDGWSFPSSRYGQDPTDGQTFDPSPDGAPLLGLLHCDLDSAERRYAPVASARLAAQPMEAWILGHVHVPRLHSPSGSAALLYPGSLLALDPGELDTHGAWLLELNAGAPPAFTQVPLSPVRYQIVNVHVDGVVSEDEVRARVLEAVREALESALVEHAGNLKFLNCRLRVTGRTALHGSMDDIISRSVDVDISRDSAVAFVDARRIIDTAPAIALHDLARGSDAAGRLASLLLSLEDDSAPPAGLQEVIAASARDVLNRPHYQRVRDIGSSEDPALLRALLRRQAAALLDRVMTQKETA
jgi:DNA repair protein SbcD/Mre11